MLCERRLQVMPSITKIPNASHNRRPALQGVTLFAFLGSTVTGANAPFVNGLALAVLSERTACPCPPTRALLPACLPAAFDKNYHASLPLDIACNRPRSKALRRSVPTPNPGLPAQRARPRAVYTAANISGGHLNPAVTVSTLLCGFYPVLHAVLYIILQVRLPFTFEADRIMHHVISSKPGASGCDRRSRKCTLVGEQTAQNQRRACRAAVLGRLPHTVLPRGPGSGDCAAGLAAEGVRPSRLRADAPAPRVLASASCGLVPQPVIPTTTALCASDAQNRTHAPSHFHPPLAPPPHTIKV
jgi:hypothetical protein